jgi:hypothetical protein
MHKLVIKPFAELDATDAANWYNRKRDGLGNEFLLALEAKINAINLIYLTHGPFLQIRLSNRLIQLLTVCCYLLF